MKKGGKREGAGRPRLISSRKKVSLTIRMRPYVAKQLDSAVGDESKSEWVERAIVESLTRWGG